MITESREAFSIGVKEILSLQRRLKHPPRRSKINKLVHSIVKRCGLRHDPNERYFTLLATCALMGRESMYNHYQPKRRIK